MIADRSVAVLAHGLGGSTDLPIPFTYALIGAAWALTFTFAVVALAWRKPRFDPDKPGRALPRWVTTLVDAPATRWVVGIAAFCSRSGWRSPRFFGPQNADNPLPGVFYVLLWVGLVALSLVSGRCGARSHRCAPCTGCLADGRCGAYPEIAGLLAGGAGPVRVRVAGTGQP